ncbi:MAG: iron-siderophore ABC transporter substrate-binding protein [Gammaproteobacteria bacterium]|nr:iron-siderophore ABC transporter substrate-binding protein [Gammaproteobacteria bacterium]
MLIKNRLIPNLIMLLVATFSTQAQVTVTDSLGQHQLPQYAKRVVVLNWDIAEQILELGVTPVGMPDISGYKEWVGRPIVPASVQDIGTRVEPNYEKIAMLKPDVIIIASPQVDLKSQLGKIAPVLFYQTFSASHDNAQAAIANFGYLAEVVNKQTVAKQKLTAMNDNIAQLKQQLLQAYQGSLPKVMTMRFASTTSVYLYGGNSMPQYALKQLGIEPALDLPSTQWGVVQKRMSDLHTLADSTALYFEPFKRKQALARSRLWQSMPFVRAKRVNSIAPSWSYGGAMSIGYIAQAITDSLLALAPASVDK